MSQSLVQTGSRAAATRVGLARLGTIAGGVALAGVLLYLAFGAVLALKLTEAERHQVSTVALTIEHEDVTFSARDGLKLAGWFFPAVRSDRALVMVHGRNGCRSCEFDGNFPKLAEQLHAAGYNILMIDLRGHGQSEGTHLTSGEEERWDVLGAADWLHARGFTQIGVLGVSMGAASTVRAASEPDGGQAIRAMVLDSCFADFDQLLEHGFTHETGYPTWVLPGGLLMTRLLLHVNLENARPARELAHTTAPVLLIYSEQDQYITAEMRQEVIAARPDAQVWSVPDGRHAEIYNGHSQEYAERVARFLDQVLQ
jgi:uncharacterized protein